MNGTMRPEAALAGTGVRGPGPPGAKRSGPPAAMGRPEDSAPTVSSAILPDPACCDCCAALLRALSAIKVELSRIRERLDQGESERAWSA
jgi:hypothetical protein